jgi:hypothetical protein
VLSTGSEYRTCGTGTRKLCYNLPLLSIVIVVTATALAPAEKTPQAIVRKSIQAMGGESLIRAVKAEYAKLRGTIYDRTSIKGAGQSDDMKFSGDAYSQPPHQSRTNLRLEATGETVTQVHNHDQGWDGEGRAADPAELTELKQWDYVGYLTSLVPLLDDKALELSVLPDVKVRGRPAAGILVKSKGKPEVRLFFDRDTGLLQKAQYRCADAEKKEVLREAYFSDYRDVSPSGADEQRLGAAKISTDGPALVEFLRKRTLDDDRRKKIEGLIKKLGDSSFDNRESAKEALVALGHIATPLLTRARESADPEISGRAKECLEKIGKSRPDTALVAGVIRLIAQRRPEDSVKVLLAYLPSAPDEEVAQEVRTALIAVAFHDGKPDPALIEARQDKDPARRAAASAILDRESPSPERGEGRDTVTPSLLRGEGPGEGKKMPTERAFVRGLKHAMKVAEYRDGKKYTEWELTEVQLFKRLDDAVFAKP